MRKVVGFFFCVLIGELIFAKRKPLNQQCRLNQLKRLLQQKPP